ncbi:ribosomal lysine N-methyltransferase 5 [Parachaetomium inaequale]|uniref:Ribosomal lysine N-methyltransferase 5 n=1 Tax=Parachaetomium inaequale TaxID=2588326 RepID=A0AAN6PAL0_9PEZI|nr:ribosomal lysine N-methyltransferase 5 [Parachaetomium inaequale]
MKVHSLLRALGAPVQDAEEETFDLFAQDLPSQNLGFIDSRATTLELTIAGRDLAITQSPGVLSSNRAGGTTGAVIWKITPLFAEWLASPTNPFFTHRLLSPSSLVLELGCGISGLVALLLAPRIARYVLTDQPYVAKLLEQNISQNLTASSTPVKKTTGRSSKSPRTTPPTGARRGSPANGRKETATAGPVPGRNGIHFTPLDWETDQVTPALTGGGEAKKKSFDVVVACDCIYNEALVEPFVATCVDLCRLRAAADLGEGDEAEPCVCVIAQQLRDPVVFEAWAARFAQSFHMWRVPDEMLGAGLKSGSGFVVHVGVLRDGGGGGGGISLEAI